MLNKCILQSPTFDVNFYMMQGLDHIAYVASEDTEVTTYTMKDGETVQEVGHVIKGAVCVVNWSKYQNRHDFFSICNKHHCINVKSIWSETSNETRLEVTRPKQRGMHIGRFHPHVDNDADTLYTHSRIKVYTERQRVKMAFAKVRNNEIRTTSQDTSPKDK